MIRSRFGVAGLDELLGGGLVKGDAALLAGSAGSGKTTLGIQFLMEGTKKGENGIYVTFEELPNQIYRDSANFGWDLKRLEKEGHLRMVCTSPGVLLDPDAAELVLGRAIAETGARRIVFDSLSHLAAFAPEGELRTSIYSMIMLLKRHGLTSVMLWEVSQLIGPSLSVTDMGLSFLLDAIILLKPVEAEGILRRAVVVLKVRGSDHDRSLRRYEITSSGFEVKGNFSEYSGVLSGTATKGEENISQLKEWLVRQPRLVGSGRFDDLCREVLGEVPGVRYCAVRNADGEVLAGGQREGVQPIESREDREKTDMRVTLMSGLFGAAPTSFGEPQILVLVFEKLRMLAYPLGEGAILLATVEAGSPENTIDAIARIATKLGLQR
ncbi:MAG: hypothetical protein JRN27_06465 [Nitrososphaerota archaeon]|nr:hypothetical protein [Nitrososphaerota archaeon]MDG6974449.1 hypothetical protein [Nitrososphaerota archaeon]MDG6975715.1 hypothetical protein [Nitrososphaerota archaeon]MDG7016607.1 hypothetical protein [Nitrososphaerota archaeon]